MEDVEFSDEFCRFLKASIPGMDAADLLLLLYRRARGGAGWRGLSSKVLLASRGG